MERDAVAQPQRSRETLEAAALGAIADHRSGPRHVLELRQRSEKNVCPLDRDQPSHPAHEKPIQRSSERLTRHVPIRVGSPPVPAVRDHVDPVARDSKTIERTHEGSRYGNDGIELPEHRELGQLVQLNRPLREARAVHSGDSRHSHRPGDARVQEVRPIAVSVHHVRTESSAQLPNQAALPKIGSRRQSQDFHFDACSTEWIDK